MSDVFAELDEVMRQEKLAKFWHENGALIITFVVMTIVGTASLSIYKNWDAAQREAQTAQLLAAVEAEDFPANIDPASLDMRGGLKAITILQAAAKHIEDEKPDKALALYESLAGNKDAPKDFRELGVLMQARLKAGQEDADTPALISDLQAIANRSKSPWRFYAHLDIAVLKAGMEDFEGARQNLKPVLEAESLPTGLTFRANALNHIYSLKHDKMAGE